MKKSGKLLSLLQLFSAERPTWTVEDAAIELGLPQSTAYEYFRSLVKEGFVAHAGIGRYMLGPAIIALDRVARRSDPLLVQGGSALDTLVSATPVDVVGLLCRLYQMKVMCVEEHASDGANFAVSYERGRLMPLFRGAASKVILAHIERRRVRRIYEENSDEIAIQGLGRDWTEFRQTLRRIRSHDVFVTRGELDPGRVGLSVPLLDGSGVAFGSISVVLAEADYDSSPSIRDQLHARLMSAASELHPVAWTPG